ncbi:MAG: hypothetical protein A2542_02495 [Parcubacteria group bacterium RIFOXYD2_FULL_52_8]|nr:MAG: hypothetical protein A2542_02495 [Parcubacteria group bacterium RIFOXYD2_FULL_52_8]
MSSYSTSKGFTLIELLVVIAIIGILSSVVLASLNSARQKGADAAIKSDLSGIRSQAEIYRDDQTNQDYGSYTLGNCITSVAGSVFADPSVANGLKHAIAQNGGDNTGASATNAVCVASTATKAYAASVKLRSSSAYWCVDSTGAARQISGAITTGSACPTS